MFYCSAPFSLLFVCLIGGMVCNYFEKRKFKKLEKELRDRGVSEKTISTARYFFLD